MITKRGEIKKSLQKKGFVEEKRAKHIQYRFYYKNRRTKIYTFVSRGAESKDISRSILSQMAEQCRVSNENFQKLIDCSLSDAEYVKLVSHLMPRCG